MTRFVSEEVDLHIDTPSARWMYIYMHAIISITLYENTACILRAMRKGSHSYEHHPSTTCQVAGGCVTP